MIWETMIYPGDFFRPNLKFKNDEFIKLVFNNPVPGKNTMLNLYFHNKFKFKNFNYLNYLRMIDLINNYYSKDIIITNSNGILILFLSALFQVYNRNKKQYFIFHTNSEAEIFYYKLVEIINDLKLKINIKLSNSRLKNKKINHNLSNFDIIVYTPGRFINNISHQNINILGNFVYISDFEKYQPQIRDNITFILNSYSTQKLHVINYISRNISTLVLDPNFRYFYI
jgi:hypothetical protein